MIPYSHQLIDEEDIKAVEGVLRSDWLTQGPTVKKFEEDLANYCGAKYAVVVSNGTAALQAAYFAIGIEQGDEIITSPLTFAATTNAAIWQGAKPIFVDIDETGNIDPELIEEKITKKTKAIVAVDYAGLPCDLDRLKNITKKHNLFLIEDAAHSLGAEYKGVKVGNIADLTTLSFHPVKSITTGEGGAITTNNKEFYEKLLLFRSHGITKDSLKFKNENEGPWYHEMQELGLNYRLTDIQSMLGSSQLKKLPDFLKRREQIGARYNEDLKGIENLILPKITKDCFSGRHLYPILLTGELQSRRKEVFEELQKNGIGAQVHYIPVYWHPYYEKLGYKKGICPKAEEWYKSEISIPIHPSLKESEQETIISMLKKILNL